MDINKKLSYNNLGFVEKRDLHRALIQDDEISQVINTITDDVYSLLEPDNLLFASNKEIKDQSFYDYYENVGRLTWHEIKKHIIEGPLAFEVIVRDNKIIAKNELDSNTISKLTNNLYQQTLGDKNITLDSNILMLFKYYNPNRISYMETIYRPYHLYRIINDLHILGTITENSPIDDLEYIKDRFIIATKIPKAYFEFKVPTLVKDNEKDPYKKLIEGIANSILKETLRIYEFNVIIPGNTKPTPVIKLDLNWGLKFF